MRSFLVFLPAVFGVFQSEAFFRGERKASFRKVEIREEGERTPKLSAFDEGVKANKDSPESHVTITVGEKDPPFFYTLNGWTPSPSRISVAGEYFNDEAGLEQGWARLFLVVDSGVAYYALRQRGSILDVYVQNGLYEEFFFEVICPFPVRSFHLREGQINATAILVTGPSRSSLHRGKTVKFSEDDGEELEDNEFPK